MSKIIAEIQLSPSCFLRNKTSTQGITEWQKIKTWAMDHRFASPPKHNTSRNIILFSVMPGHWLRSNTERKVPPLKSPTSLVITLRFSLEVSQRQSSPESYITLRCGKITAWDTVAATHITICHHHHPLDYTQSIVCGGVESLFLYVFPVSSARFKTKANLWLQTPLTIWMPRSNFR